MIWGGEYLLNKGFTLVELLAVIVILAIILVIAVPRIMEVISSAKKGSLENTAKLIASSAEKEYQTREMLGDTSTLTCADVVKLSTSDYETCTLTKIDNKVLVNIKGSGKFEGKYICNGTKENAVIRDEDCSQYAINVIATSNNVSIDETSDKNIRYEGSNPNNYVTFNNETWRIIGIFNVSNGTTTEPRVKLVRNASIGNYSWDSSASDVNSGYGYNDWSSADLNTLLNNYYYNGATNVTVYNEQNNANTTATFTGLTTTAKSMIDTVVWNLGGNVYSNPNTLPYGLPLSTQYTAERGTTVYTERPTTWSGKIGLIYPSDYGYASADSECRSNLRAGVTYTNSTWNYTNAKCKNNNWLHIGSYYWTLSPYSSYSCVVFFVSSSGFVDGGNAYGGFGVRPSIYLKSNIKITSGNGSSGDPYILNA